MQRTPRFHVHKGWSLSTLAFPPGFIIGDSHNSTNTERVSVCQKGGIMEIKLKEWVTLIFFKGSLKKIIQLSKYLSIILKWPN
jgi:hypothetical protein